MRERNKICCALLIGLFASAEIARSRTTSSASEISKPLHNETGLASYYADKYHGKATASGEPHDRLKLTAAHPTLPFAH